LAAHRQPVLGFLDHTLSEVSSAGDQDVGLSGEFLVKPPVAGVGYRGGNLVCGASFLGNGNSAIERSDEIAVDKWFFGAFPGAQLLPEIKALQRAVRCRRGIQAGDSRLPGIVFHQIASNVKRGRMAPYTERY
jgi:hypothetical protein